MNIYKLHIILITLIKKYIILINYSKIRVIINVVITLSNGDFNNIFIGY